MSKINLSVLFTAIAALAGCATNTGIVQLTDDTYMYGKQDMLAWSGSVVKAEMYKEAIAFCKGKGQKFAPLDSTSSDYVVSGSLAGAEIQFKCR